jgi:hypothetical protein
MNTYKNHYVRTTNKESSIHNLITSLGCSRCCCCCCCCCCGKEYARHIIFHSLFSYLINRRMKYCCYVSECFMLLHIKYHNEENVVNTNNKKKVFGKTDIVILSQLLTPLFKATQTKYQKA